MHDDELNHIVGKSRDAKNGGFDALSTSEQLAAAFVLNRPDWLGSAGYTMAEAVERLGAKWLALIPPAARILRDDDDDDEISAG
ncbi:hypothetical protein [Mesorhizobium sp. Mes31]|uniref:hypothetical protein n=1 Tax=Mesorhizobium sp. Mes31 TaxID=2926017 RepID=UPI0021191276|nr:hypothetical protein [Mesorhizobium sp. Mes31]